MKRLLRSLPSKVLKVSKEEGSRTSHNPLQCLTTLKEIFFSSYSAGVSLTATVPSCPFTSKGLKTPTNCLLNLPCSRLSKAGLVSSQVLQPLNIFLVSSLSCLAGRAKNWARSSGRNLNSTKQMGNDTRMF